MFAGITPLMWILFGSGLLAALLYLLFGPMRYRRLIAAVRRQSDRQQLSLPTDADGNPLKISVIAYSRGQHDEIAAFLETMANQQYPSVEVTIVVDGPAREAANLSESFADAYPFAGFSFVPPEARNLSRRKLANTIGIKKSSGDIILTTLTNIEIPSDTWLALMAAPFADENIEIVLGAASLDFTPMRGIKRWYRRFDSLITNAQWMLSALTGKPYRGDGTNLAFRRQLFFRNSGYGNNYYLHAGDDDIFVSQVSTRDNSSMVLAPQATVKANWGESSARIWISQKERYTFAARYITNMPRLLPALLNIFNWLASALLISAVILPLPGNITMPVAASVALLAFWGCQIASYRSLAATFRSIRLWWAVPCFLLLRPVADSLFRLKYFRRRNQNFTWRR